MSNKLGTLTLFKRETNRFMKVYLQTLFAPVFSNLLYFAIFGLSLYKAVPDVNGITYLQFLVPGLIAMGIINNAFQNPSSSLIIMKYQGLIQNLLTIPLKRSEIMLAFVFSAVLRGLLVGFMTYLTAIIFVELPYHSFLIITLAALIIALFFSFLGLLVGIWAKEFDRNAFVQNFVLTPLTFLGGVFYSLDRLPQIAQNISMANPIVYLIDLLRYGFTGVHSYPIGISFAVSITITAILGAITYLVLKSGWRLEN